ncbi:alpha/beta hydrolase [Streptomyces sp. NPDC028635]|uniref:alpha/beta fold hydrolase n=1 Tax=Streptomyces sp. NPDC028635 TaxID=3154800 RepID=UPI0033E58B85
MTDGVTDMATAGPGTGGLRPLLDAVHETACEVRARRPDYFEQRPLRLPADLLERHGAGRDEVRRLVSEAYGLRLEPAADARDCTAVDRLAATRAARGPEPGAGGSGGGTDSGGVPTAAGLAAVVREQDEARRSLEQQAARIARTEPRRVGVMGGVLPYVAAGTARDGEPPVVLVNALGMGTALWHPLMAALAPAHRVLTWAPRGTRAGTRPLRLRDQADDLAAVLAAEGVRECHLVGWCSGPKTAVEFHRRRPDAVRSMVFLHGSFRHTGDPAGREPDTPYERGLEELCRAVAARPALAARMRALFTGRRAGLPDDLSAHRFAEEVLALPAPGLEEELLRPFADDVLPAYARQLLDYWDHDALAHAGRVRVPVLCVTAEFDRIASPERLAQAAGRFPDARHERLPGATHYSMYDRPREVARLLGDFFSTARPRSIVSGTAR